MKNKLTILIAVWALLFLVSCNNRQKGELILLNGVWDIAETVYMDSIPRNFEHTIQVPSFIDMAEPAFDPLDYPNDTNRYFWYRKEFTCKHTHADVALLELRKVKYGAKVMVNGHEVAQHNLAYSSAQIDIKQYLKADSQVNELLIRVGTRENFPDSLVCGADFEKKTFYPGIFDDVKLHVKTMPYIQNTQVVSDVDKDMVKVYFNIQSNSELKEVDIDYRVIEYAGQKEISKGKQAVKLDKSNLSVELEIPLDDYQLWSPENPFLYELQLSTGSDVQSVRFGMRSFTINQQTKRFELNGNPYFLLGTNVAFYRFAEDAQRGYKAWNKEWVRQLFERFKEMNWNSFRFHVGPAPDFWYDLADEMGFLIQDEYSIWYGKGGVHSLDPKISAEQLAGEYENWMRDRWNHPSIVIWDAQNETVSRHTGPAIEMVRDLDHSNRPWDNGYSKPARETDMIESHPYLLYEFSQKGATVPDEGIMEHLLGKVKLPYNDPNEQDPDPEGGHYDNAVVINEYGWLWLNRDGSPTTLTDNVYGLLFPEATTPESRFEIYARTLAAMTEYWRAHQKVAGIQHFAGLTYSRPEEPRGQTCDVFKDLDSLEWNDAFKKYVKPAFSKVAVMSDLWEKEYTRGYNIEGPFIIINDSDEQWSGMVTVSVCKDEQLISRLPYPSELKKHSVKKQFFNIEGPVKPGLYELRIELEYKNELVTSYRDVLVN